MTSVIHDTFVIQRNYPATPSRVFAAFTSAEAKNTWGDSPDAGPAPGSDSEFDFRVGGHERFGHVYQGTRYLYDAVYYDIVTDQRIIYSYEMYAGDARISVSVSTIEFAKDGDGTSLTVTEQGAYLDGIDGNEAPALRRGGIEEQLDGLTGYLARTAS